MTILKFIVSICIFSSTGFVRNAQTKAKTTITPVTKVKPPVVKTFLGRNQDGAVVTVEEGKQLVGLPLKITDAKNVAYNLSSYQFMSKKKSVIENEDTGRKELAFTTVADVFNTSPLPQIWVTYISDTVSPTDDEFSFSVSIFALKLHLNSFHPHIQFTPQ